MLRNDRVYFVNTLRGFAALSVLISHYFGVFWISPQVVETLIKREIPMGVHVPIIVEAFQIHPLFNWGAVGVALFFIISGFVIPMSLRKLSASAFLRNRIIRLFPTYAAGFTVSLVAIGLNVVSSGGDWPFPLSHVIFHFIPGIRDLLGTTSIDGIIWTLEIEIKFYILCACFAPLFFRQSPWVLFLPAALALFVILLPLTGQAATNSFLGALVFPAQFMIYMFTGVTFYFYFIGRLTKASTFFIAFAILFIFLLAWYIYPVIPFYLACNYIISFILFAFALTFPWAIPKTRFTDFLADISYPLYVVHGVAGYTMLAVLLEAGFSSTISLVVTTISALSLSYTIHTYIEKPSVKWSKTTRKSSKKTPL